MHHTTQCLIRASTLLVCAGVVVCVAAASDAKPAASAANEGVLEVTGTTADYRFLRLELKPDAALPVYKGRGKEKHRFSLPPPVLCLGSVGNRLNQMWYLPRGHRVRPVYVQVRERDSSALKIADSQWKGAIRFRPRLYRPQRAGGMPLSDIELALEVNLTDGNASGTFTWALERRGKHGEKEQEPERERFAGTLTGSLRTGKELAESQGLAPGHDYPCERNRDGSGASKDSGDELVESLRHARLQWVSEDNLAGSWGSGYMNHLGGYASTVVADGKVYAYYFRPTVSPEFTREEIVHNRAGAWTEEDKERYSRAEADEVIVCIDAATGMTVWKRAFIKDGINMTEMAKSGPYNTPCFANGRIYAQGTLGRVYCLDGKTGAFVWRHNFGVSKKPRPITFALQEADGVVLVSTTGTRACGLDAHTGERLWVGPMKASSRGNGTAVPVSWCYEGKWYFVSPQGCYEAKTGKCCWSLPHRGCFTTISGNYLVVSGGLTVPRGKRKPDDFSFSGLACYRITPEKAEAVWNLRDEHITGYWSSGPVIYKGHVYGTSLMENKKGVGGMPKRVDAQYCVELATGKLMGRIDERGDSYYGWLAQNGRVYRPQKMWLYNPDPLDFRVYDNQANPLAIAGECLTPTLVDGRLFVRCNAGFLTCVDLRKPAATQGVSGDAP